MERRLETPRRARLAVSLLLLLLTCITVVSGSYMVGLGEPATVPPVELRAAACGLLRPAADGDRSNTTTQARPTSPARPQTSTSWCGLHLPATAPGTLRAALTRWPPPAAAPAGLRQPHADGKRDPHTPLRQGLRVRRRSQRQVGARAARQPLQQPRPCGPERTPRARLAAATALCTSMRTPAWPRSWSRSRSSSSSRCAGADGHRWAAEAEPAPLPGASCQLPADSRHPRPCRLGIPLLPSPTPHPPSRAPFCSPMQPHAAQPRFGFQACRPSS
jgi:hypothetical protein